MPFAREVSFPWRGGSDGVLPGPERLVAWRPWKVQIAPPSEESGGGESSANRQDYSNAALFYATCQASDAVGAVVYSTSGSVDGDSEAVTTADSNNPYPAVGLLVSKKTPTDCVVQRYGPAGGVLTGLTPKARCSLGRNGGLLVPPFDAKDPVFVQQIGYALDATTFFVQLGNTVIKREGEDPIKLRIGSGAPQDGQDGPLQDAYIDRDVGQIYFKPAARSDASNVYVGSGPPTDNLGTPVNVYFAQDTGSLYVEDAAFGGQSTLILGFGPPAAGVQPVTTTFYIDTATTEIYPNG